MSSKSHPTPPHHPVKPHATDKAEKPSWLSKTFGSGADDESDKKGHAHGEKAATDKAAADRVPLERHTHEVEAKKKEETPTPNLPSEPTQKDQGRSDNAKPNTPITPQERKAKENEQTAMGMTRERKVAEDALSLPPSERYQPGTAPSHDKTPHLAPAAIAGYQGATSLCPVCGGVLAGVSDLSNTYAGASGEADKAIERGEGKLPLQTVNSPENEPTDKLPGDNVPAPTTKADKADKADTRHGKRDEE